MDPSGLNLPTPPDQGKQSQLLGGVISTSIGVVLLAVGLIQLLFFYLPGKTPRLTIELILIPMGLLFGIPGALDLRRSLLNRWVMRHGVPAQAEVLRRDFTKKQYNGNPVSRLRLRVLPRDGEPYVVTIDWIAHTELMMLTPGRVVPVKVHPTKPRAVVIAA
ncbi:hypothetical protein [Sorangium sp. So ce861]|uniref:hypothetical protein n=1 Tax=Sorangium sp. So ce861 TaxID=3133323 RepID=UPI003F62B6E2